MSNYTNIENIRADYNNGKYNSKIRIPSKLMADHVFDEDLSVKQNRQMVEAHNANVDKIRAEKLNQQAELSKQLHADVVAYIMYVYDMTKAQAELVESYAYTEKHSCMGDYFSAIDDLAEMVFNVLQAKN